MDLNIGLFQKNLHFHNGRHAGKSHGRGANSSGNSALSLKIHPPGLLSIQFH